MRILWPVTLASAFVLLASGSYFKDASPASGSTASSQALAYAARGAAKLESAYQVWVNAHEAAGGDRNVRMPLTYSKSLSHEFTTAYGSATLDLIEGRIEVEVAHAPEGELDVWIVDNRVGTGTSVRADASDIRIHLGRLERDGNGARLELDLGSDFFAQLQPDLVVVARSNAGPEQGLLYGSVSLFQRLYTSLRTPELLQVSDYAPPAAAERSSFGISVANAAEVIVDRDVLFDSLVAAGADLFINETFDGNGRTCATCHPLANNTQLSVSDIARLPDNDPLFIAEFLPTLAFMPAGPKFEVPPLMRGAGLIVENVDGMADLVNRFTMRGIPHTLALSTSLDPAVGDGTTIPPVQRTGWSGDGAPNSGSLRDFATGAVTQHFPLTLARIPGFDFRLPTDPELDAMEAFQLSLGRSQDLQLPLNLLDPIVARGQEIFLSPEARCNGCHNNASANTAAGTNRNFATGVEDQVDRPIATILADLGIDLTPGVPGNVFPRDAGFGQSGNPANGFGNGTFNTTPLVEAADTAPFFHDNQIRTIEGAVAFYNGESFANSPAGTPAIDLQPTQIEAVAAFLRAINALENIRASRELIATVRSLPAAQRDTVGPPLLLQAGIEIDDAIEVLVAADLQPAAVADLLAARALIPANRGIQPARAAQILTALDRARGRIVL